MTDKEDKADKAELDPSRRRFIKNSGMVVGGLAGGSLLGGLLTKDQLTTTPQDDKVDAGSYAEARMFFTRFEDFVVLEQVTERIYPEDDNGPGAIELGVPYYIDKQLAGPWGMNSKEYRDGPFETSDPSTENSRLTRGDLFINGIRTINKVSQDEFDNTFDKAEEDEQMELLENLEKGEVEMKGVASDSFFELLRDMTLEGVYSDPLYGGNKDMKGWEMMEFPGARSSYNDVVDSDEFVKLDPVSLKDYQQKS